MSKSKKDKALTLLQEISDKTDQFHQIYKDLTSEEKIDVGCIISVVFSPKNKIGHVTRIGHVLLIYGAVVLLKDQLPEFNKIEVKGDVMDDDSDDPLKKLTEILESGGESKVIL